MAQHFVEGRLGGVVHGPIILDKRLPSSGPMLKGIPTLSWALQQGHYEMGEHSSPQTGVNLYAF